MRVLVSAELVNSCEERQNFWQQLKDVAGLNQAPVDEAAIVEQARAELLGQIGASLANFGSAMPMAAASMPVAVSGAPAKGADGFESAWIDTPECTACDECTKLAPKAFAYNADKKAVIIDPRGTTFANFVKAAEKCTAGVIHPGTPWNPKESGLDKLIARAAKYN
jgi:pyruvate-ferredoxin/flavodoxin oxidoreductase